MRETRQWLRGRFTTEGDIHHHFIGVKGAYGNYIRIKHNNELSTAYAHARSFIPDIKKGSQIKQGQVIAYVGTTGRSTGPHLHYEVLVKGKHINPLSIKSIPIKKLSGSDLANFKKHKNSVDKMLVLNNNTTSANKL